MSKIGRNDPCPCGSGRKYKACCAAAARMPQADPAALSRQRVDAAWQAIGARNLDAAEKLLREALDLDRDNPDAWHLLGIAAFHRGDHALAAERVKEALGRTASNASFFNSLGNILQAGGRPGEAVDAFRCALALQPGFPQAHYNLGIALRESGAIEEAVFHYRQALALQPDFPQAHYNLALALLLLGRLEEGWGEYEWRWLCSGFSSKRRHFPQPLWIGGDIGGRTILLHAEQGFGDTLQFIRYAPRVEALGATVLVECQPELKALLAASFPSLRFFAAGETLPSFDVHCPLASLPGAFATALETVPAEIPYLKADPALVLAWRGRLGGLPGLKAGLVWAGNPNHLRDRQRSVPLAALECLLDLPGVTWVSLQKGDARRELEPYAGKVLDVADELTDFGQTAALVSGLDLVVSVDTAVAHLAGALGRPVLTLHSRWPDWRWLLDRPDSPWYPTLKVFRQESPGDWTEPVARLAEEIRSQA